MTDDIVARLRDTKRQRTWWPRDRLEAADEIERLRAILEKAHSFIFNGIAVGGITLPDPALMDEANKIPKIIRAALGEKTND